MMSQPGDDSLKELREALETALQSRGTMGKVRAQLRAEIFNTLNDTEGRDSIPAPPRENVIINELIREYFEFNGYHHSLSTFTAGKSNNLRPDVTCSSESGTPQERPFSREFLQQEIGAHPALAEGPMPLMYKLVPCRRVKGDEGSSPFTEGLAEFEESSGCLQSSSTKTAGAPAEAEIAGLWEDRERSDASPARLFAGRTNSEAAAVVAGPLREESEEKDEIFTTLSLLMSEDLVASPSSDNIMTNIIRLRTVARSATGDGAVRALQRPIRELLLHEEVVVDMAMYDCCKLLAYMPLDFLLASTDDSTLSDRIRITLCSILLSKAAAAAQLEFETSRVRSVLIPLLGELTGVDATMARDIE
ncbi:hypothetical protein FOZ63_034159, partial [Perkinsus olseni]